MKDQRYWIEFVYREYFPLFLATGMKRYGLDMDMAKEKIQETFVMVWKRHASIKNNTEPGVRGYAMRTFRNVCLNHIKRKHPFVDMNSSRETDDYIDHVRDEGVHPLFEILLIEEKRLQDIAITMLPEKYQAVVRLSLGGLTPREIARKTDLKMATLTNYKHRGLKKYETIINALDPLRKR